MSTIREKIEERFAALIAANRLSEDLIGVFADFITTAPDEELFHINPYRFATRTGTPRQQAVDLFLYATHVGVLAFRWGVLCPSCGAFLSTDSGLRWLKSGQDCALCTLPFEASVDEDVEVTFTVSPEIRKIRFHDLEGLSCGEDYMHLMFSTSTLLYPEIHQIFHNSFRECFRIEACTIQEFEFDFEPGHHMILAPATHSVAHIPVKEGSENQIIDIEILFDGQLIPETAPAIPPGPGMVRINNRANNQIALGLIADDRLAPTPFEQRSFPIQPLYEVTPYLTGKQLVTNQVFNDLFRTESIPAGAGLEFKNLAFLFTDLKGSTSMYERLGDFRAYALVNAHFALLRGIVAAKGGAIVKTMGDAIMATFSSGHHAFEAALLMRKEVSKFGSDEDLILKVGIHSGSTLAVAANQQLDYFGQTVNIANRIQNQAEPNEIVVTESVYQLEDVIRLVASGRMSVITDQVHLRGVTNPVTIYRIS